MRQVGAQSAKMYRNLPLNRTVVVTENWLSIGVKPRLGNIYISVLYLEYLKNVHPNFCHLYIYIYPLIHSHVHVSLHSYGNILYYEHQSSWCLPRVNVMSESEW